MAIADIVASMAAGTWHELPGTNMSAVFPPKEGHPAWGVEGPAAVVADWCGAAFDTERNVLVITGGGHTAYGGNEIYEFSLPDIKWARVTDPSPMIPDASKGGDPCYVTTDGSRVSCHTYDGLEYVPPLKSLFLWGGAAYRSGNPDDSHAYLVDLQTHKWQQKALSPSAVIEVATAWDSKRNRMLCVFKTGLYAYDPTVDKWSVVANGWWYQTNCTAAYDPDHDLMLLLSSEPHTQASYIGFTKDTTLAKAPLDGPCPTSRAGLVYCPDVKKFVIWTGDTTVWTIDPETWHVEQHQASSGPSSKNADGTAKNEGTYSRWPYSPAYKCFIGYNSANENVWLYKLAESGSAAVTPPAIPPVTPTNPPATGGSGPGIISVVRVGPGQFYKKPSAAAGAVKDGDTVKIDAGTYTDGCAWPCSVNIESATDEMPVIGGYVAEGKGVFVTQGKETRLTNIKLIDGLGGNSNAAGIRHEGGSLILQSCEIYNCHNGILTGHMPDAELHVLDTHFHHMNTVGDLAHNIYAGKIARVIVQGCFFEDGQSGHFIKSLGAHTTIEANRIIQVNDLDAALIDLWGDQTFEVVGNAMMRPGTYGAMAFMQITYRLNNGVPEAEIPGRVKQGLVAYNTAFFNNPAHDDPRYSNLVHYNYPMPNLLVANNVGIHLNELVMDDHNYGFAKNGTDSNNYWTKNWTPEVFVDPSKGDLRLVKPLLAASPIAFVPTLQPAIPIGTQARADASSVGAYAVDGQAQPVTPPVQPPVEPPPVEQPASLQPGAYTLDAGTYTFTVEK